MYLVTIINDKTEIVINEISTKTNNRLQSGTIKQGINTINSFTFTILPNNVGYNFIQPLKTLVRVLNTKTNKYEFIGRVLNLTNSMSNNGLISKTCICESELAYLLDSQQKYEEIHNISVRGYLEKLITAHNRNVDSKKTFIVGNVNVVDSNDSLYRYISYDTTKKNIEDDLINKLGGELQIRYSGNIRYLDYLNEIGKICDTEIRLAKNLQDIDQSIDINSYCNRLVVLGAKLKVKDKEGNEIDTENRLTIESINNGLMYIDDKESISKYGVIQGQVIYDDVTEVKNLLSKGKEYLLNQRILISNKINALDLSTIGIDIDSFEVGNYYPLIHEILGINDIVRIVEKTIDIENPQISSITLGNKEKDIKQYNVNIKKQLNKTIELERKITNVNDAMAETNNNIINISDEIAKLSLSTGNDIKDIIENSKSLSELVSKISESLIDVNSNLETINNQLQDLDTKIKELDIRVKELEGVEEDGQYR